MHSWSGKLFLIHVVKKRKRKNVADVREKKYRDSAKVVKRAEHESQHESGSVFVKRLLERYHV